MQQEKQFGPIVMAGILIGAGVGGFLEAIVFRQILQSHAMLSTKVPLRAMSNLKTSLLWDGLLQVFLLAAIVIGVIVLFQAGKKKDIPWSGQLLFGSWFLGWGIYNLAEGLAAHLLLRAHHLLEFSKPATQETGDYAYIGSGVLLGILGYWALASTRSELEDQERVAARALRAAKEVKGDRKVYLD